MATLPQGRCAECGYDWAEPVETLVAGVRESPQRYRDLFGEGDGPRSRDDGVWSPREYLWHVVDVLRYGAERLWSLSLDPGAGLMPWDERVALSVRDASPMSAVVGLRAMERAADEWLRAAAETPAGVTAEHPELGPMDRDDVVRRNAHEIVHHALDIERGLRHQV